VGRPPNTLKIEEKGMTRREEDILARCVSLRSEVEKLSRQGEVLERKLEELQDLLGERETFALYCQQQFMGRLLEIRDALRGDVTLTPMVREVLFDSLIAECHVPRSEGSEFQLHLNAQ
jgi:hypothetical protein